MKKPALANYIIFPTMIAIKRDKPNDLTKKEIYRLYSHLCGEKLATVNDQPVATN